MLTEFDRVDIARRFDFNPISGEAVIAMRDIRAGCKNLATFILDNLSDCRERSLALTHLEEVMFFANAGVAREDKPLK